MAARNKCLARITNRGPSNPTRGWVRPMNPFRGWRDEPVSRAATERFTGRLLGAFAEARPCSEVPSLSLTVRWGQFPPLVERNKMLARRPRNRTGIDRH